MATAPLRNLKCHIVERLTRNEDTHTKKLSAIQYDDTIGTLLFTFQLINVVIGNVRTSFSKLFVHCFGISFAFGIKKSQTRKRRFDVVRQIFIIV